MYFFNISKYAIDNDDDNVNDNKALLTWPAHF